MYKYTATVTRVVDGDTLDLLIDCGFGITKKIRARLYGIDAPETYGVKHSSAEYVKGKAATDFVVKWLKNVNYEVIILTHKDKKGKYGRYLAEIVSPKTLKLLNEDLVTSGHAIGKIYD